MDNAESTRTQTVAAVPAPMPTAPAVDEARLKDLASELRCLVCQNQSIADSTAGLALDLKNQIVEQMQAGKNDQQIKQYMVERYGEFVLYKPAVSWGNALLWAGPFVLLVVFAVMARLWWKKISLAARAKASAPAPQTGTRSDQNDPEALYQRWKNTSDPSKK